VENNILFRNNKIYYNLIFEFDVKNFFISNKLDEYLKIIEEEEFLNGEVFLSNYYKYRYGIKRNE